MNFFANFAPTGSGAQRFAGTTCLPSSHATAGKPWCTCVHVFARQLSVVQSLPSSQLAGTQPAGCNVLVVLDVEVTLVLVLVVLVLVVVIKSTWTSAGALSSGSVPSPKPSSATTS